VGGIGRDDRPQAPRAVGVRAKREQGVAFDRSCVMAIRQTPHDIVVIDRDLAEHGLSKYARFPEKQALLADAFKQFNDPATMLTSDGDQGFDYAFHSPTHGPCNVDVQTQHNIVTELQVRNAEGSMLACLRPHALWVPPVVVTG